MFIPRTDGQSCQSISCGSTDSTSSDHQSTRNNTTNFNTPIPTRFIGVAMVVGAIIIILVLWIWLGSWPRKALSKYFCCWRKRLRPNGKDKDMIIDLSASLPDLKKPKRVRIRERKNEHEEMEPGGSGAGEPKPSLHGREPKDRRVPNNPSGKRGKDAEGNDRHRHEGRKEARRSRNSSRKDGVRR